MALFGLGTSCVFSPLANLATCGLDHRTAGAGAGAFNSNRQIGGVIGSAAIVAMLTSRLGHTVPAAAKDAAASLPDAVRGQFLDRFSHLSGSAFSSGSASAPQLPSSVPPAVADQIKAAALQAVHHGFATAVAETMLLAVAVFTLGLVSALLMHGQRAQRRSVPDETPAAAAA